MTVTAQTNDFSILTASRRSTRAFTDQEIPAEVLEAILADATTAPSWSNTRAFRVALATGERADIEGRNRVARRNVTAFDAPVMGFVFVHEDMLPWSAMDAGLMLQTLFLSAKSRGVDSCPIGFLAIWREPVEAEFEIPEGYRLITGFALGYADPEAPINTMQAPRPPIQLLEGK